MKKMTKKEFLNETMNVIQSINYEDLEKVRRGLYILYKELKKRNCFELERLNELSSCLLKIIFSTTEETMRRDGEMPK